MDKDKLQNAYDSLKRLHDTTNSVIKRLENDNFSLRQQIEILSAGNRQHNKSQINQNNIIQKTLDAKNAEIEQLNLRIQELKNKNRALKNGK